MVAITDELEALELVVTEELDTEELLDEMIREEEEELTPGKFPESDLEEPPPQADSASAIKETSALWRQQIKN